MVFLWWWIVCVVGGFFGCLIKRDGDCDKDLCEESIEFSILEIVDRFIIIGWFKLLNLFLLLKSIVFDIIFEFMILLKCNKYMNK